ncbi:hypothetical protein FRB98_003955, partial [Tulasnella sp. 332]
MPPPWQSRWHRIRRWPGSKDSRWRDQFNITTRQPPEVETVTTYAESSAQSLDAQMQSRHSRCPVVTKLSPGALSGSK